MVILQGAINFLTKTLVVKDIFNLLISLQQKENIFLYWRGNEHKKKNVT